MKRTAHVVTYWDTSAIVSVLFSDEHSASATTFARAKGTHVMSSLAWSEAHAVIARIERERICAKMLIDAARAAFEGGPWRRLHLDPDWASVVRLARAWPLRGADLWHLATAKNLQMEIPEIAFLSYDNHLLAAARGEGLHSPG
ncbi:MAG: hypothetical protein PVSMB8_11220 [Vulcanimicrobiaceae bacterium]